eukprot:gene18387-22005_t
MFTDPTKGLGLSVNTTLHLLCCAGLIFSALSLFTTSTATYIGLMWFSYYCIVDVGQIFYSYQLEVLLVLGAELLVPPLFFAFRPFKIGASLTSIVLQLMIILTGNYNFFNYLTIGLCVLLLDDAFLLSRAIPKILRQKLAEIEATKNRIYAFKKPEIGLSAINSKNLLVPFVFILIGTSTIYSASRHLQRQSLPSIIVRMHSAMDFYSLTGTYGLFSQVTTERFEVVIEGSADGELWQEYEFYYKPGNLSRSPPLIFPGHKPRLDWQMWFAAISKDSRTQGWIIHFMAKLLEGSPEVLSLIEYSPFPLETPPKYIRAQKYQYTFTDWTTSSDAWWHREFVGVFVRPFSLDDSSYNYFISNK